MSDSLLLEVCSMLLPPSAPPRTAVATDNLNPKRLPLYLVLQTSGGMDGEPIEAIRITLLLEINSKT